MPSPPYVDTFTRLDELPHPPVGLIVQSLRALPSGYTGCYQVCSQPVHDDRWLHNIQSLHDHRFRLLKEPAGPEGGPQSAWTQQIPSASLTHLTQETYEKNHNDRAYYFMLSRVALWSPVPDPPEDVAPISGDVPCRERDLACLQCLATPVLAIRQNGRAMGTIPPDQVSETLGKHQRLSTVLETGQVHRHGVLVNTDELAAFVHLPSLDVIEQLGLDHLLREPLAPQATDPDGTGVGVCIDGDSRTRVTIPRAMRCSHAHMIGRTGFGKSTLMTAMGLDDIRRGDGVMVMDPHGQLVKDLADRLPPEIAERARWVDFNDPKHAVLYNPLRAGGSSQLAAEVADDFIGGFKDMTSGWGDRLEHINRNIISAVAELPEGSLLEAMLALERKSERGERTRQRLIEGCSDPIVRWFFRDHFKVYSNADLNPAHHKFSKLLQAGHASLCMRQPDNRLDIARWMERGEIVLVNLGSISREYKHILGSFLIANVFTAAQARGSIHEKRLKPFHLYIDECHRFSPALQSDMIQEVRKNNVGLTLAHQHLRQLPTESVNGVGSAGTSIVFNVDRSDAEAMARSFQGRVQGKQIMALRHFEAYARVGHEVVHLHTPHYTELPPKTGMFEAIYERSVRDWYVDRRLLQAQTNALIEDTTRSDDAKPVPAPTIPQEVLPDAPEWPFEQPPRAHDQQD
ncbi:MAG: type IV secretion system DNA-binding domain-containing protein [Planctomycetota bacterium]